MKINKQEGYTLIEVLVGVNLTLIAITILVTFFLFSSRFISTIESRSVSRNDIAVSSTSIIEMFKYSDDFHAVFSDNCSLIFNNEDTLLVTADKISIKNIYILDELEGLELAFFLENGTIITFPKGDESAGENIKINNKNLDKISLHFVKDKNKFNMELVLPNTPGRRFNNISSVDLGENL